MKTEDDMIGNDEQLMAEAIRICQRGIDARQSPFGAVIADRTGKIVAATHNTVRLTCDPTAHAEINAIRLAARNLGTIDLSGHRILSTCEPCPMCASAIHWSRLDEVVYGATIQDAADAGFHELELPCAELYQKAGSHVRCRGGVLGDSCRDLFRTWKSGPNPSPY
ncbi:MAG: nucleoside deaminase [Planctomycetota bacterium]